MQVLAIFLEIFPVLFSGLPRSRRDVRGFPLSTALVNDKRG
jgi:hypothetical protein